MTSNDGCVYDNSAVVTAEIYSKPTAEFTADEVCFGNETTLTADKVNNAKAYNWDFDNDGNIDDSTVDNVVRYAFGNAGLHTVALTVVSENDCVSDSVNRIVRVHFAPIADAGHDQTVNYKDIATLIGDDGTDAEYDDFLFSWTPADKVENANSYSTQTVQLEETTMFYLTVTNKYNTDCYSIDSVTVTVEGSPLTAHMAIDNDSICENETATVSVTTANGVGNYQYSWAPAEYFVDANAASTTFRPNNVYNISEVVSITCTVTSGDETVVLNQDITVFDYLDANAYQDTAVVYNTAASLKAIVPDGVNADNFIFSWSPDTLLTNPNGITTETVKLTETAIFTLTVTNKAFDACSNSDNVTVTVNGGPLALALSVDNDSICDNSFTTLKAVASGGSESYIYTWSPATGLDDTTIANPTFTPDNISEAYRNYTFYCEVSDGYNTVTDTVTVTVFDYLDANAGNDTSIVKNDIAYLRALIPNGINADNFIFTWTPDDKVVNDDMLETETVQLEETTTFTLIVTNKYFDACQSSDDMVVMVYDQAVADFSANDVCLGDTTYFKFTGGVIPGAEYSWNFGDGNGSSNIKDPYYVYGTSGQFEVFLTVSTADSDSTISKFVNVYEIPVAEFTADEVCFGNETTLTADKVNNAKAYNWDFDNDGNIDDSTVDNVVRYAFGNAGLHTVALTVVSENDCVSDSVNRIVRVHFAPIADAGHDQTVNYKDIATLIGDDGTDAEYDDFLFSWTPADKVENANSYSTQTVQLEETTMFYLTVTNKYNTDCYSIDSVTVTVEGSPLTAHMAIDNDSICENETATVSVTTANGVGNYQYSWAPAEYFVDANAASTTFRPNNVYNISEVVSITCTVTSGDETVVLNQDITVFDYLDANAYQDTAVVYNTAASLKAIVPDGVNADNFIFSWSPDTLLTNPNSYATSTINLTEDATFTLTVRNKENENCINTDEIIVRVGEPLSLDLTIVGNNEICDNESTSFKAVASGGSGSYIYTWTPATGLDDATIANPTFTPNEIDELSKSFQFICEVNDGYNSISDTVNVIVNKTPKAEFTTNDVCLGEETIFNATIVDGATYTWNFGDGNSETTSTNTTSHKYLTADKFNVTLTVTSVHGCVSEMFSKEVDVFSLPVAEFTADDICFGEETIFNATIVDGIKEYKWNFGDGSQEVVTTIPTATHKYAAANQDSGYEVTLTVLSDNNCESTPTTNTVKVFEVLEANAGPDQLIQYGTKTTIEAIVPENVNIDNFNFKWEPADLLVNPNSLTTETKFHMVKPQTFTLIVTNKLNEDCYSTDDVYINVDGDALVVTDTICDDGVSYPDGKYWLYNEKGWDFSFPGRYQGDGNITIDEHGNLMNVEYDITLLNELKASEIGLGSNAQQVYHLGLGFDFYVFDIRDVTGSGTDEDIDGFENVEATFEWSLETIEGDTPWTFDHSTNNITTVNVKSEGYAYLRCYISSLCGTIEKWIMLYTPGYEPCKNVSDLQATITNSTSAEIEWQSTTDKYEVRYGTTPDCSKSIIITDNHLTINDLEPNTTYYWKVRSICEDETLNIGFVDGPKFITYDIAMYPNPANDKVTIEGKNLSSIELYNALGVMVHREKEIINHTVTINTSSFGRGLYFVRYTMSDGTTDVMRLVIE